MIKRLFWIVTVAAYIVVIVWLVALVSGGIVAQ